MVIVTGIGEQEALCGETDSLVATIQERFLASLGMATNVMSPLFASVTSLGMTTLVSSKADQGAEESAKAFPRG